MKPPLAFTKSWKSAFARNVSWTFSGYVVPLVAAVVLIPQTLQNAGKENYGLLALASVLVGFSGVFDLGLGRSLTFNLVRARINGSPAEFRSFYITGLMLLATLGVLVAAAILTVRPWLVELFGADASVSQVEVQRIIAQVGLAVPFVLVQVAGMSVLESAAKFKQVSILKSAISTLIFVAPFLTSVFSASASSLVCALLAVRVLGALLGTAAAFREVYELGGRRSRDSMFRCLSIGSAKRLFAYGSWVALSNVIGAVLTRGDVVLISLIMGVTAVATYSAAVEVISKLGVVGTSIGLVLFSKISQEIDVRPNVARRYFRTALVLTAVVLAPVCLGLAVFSDEIMSFWLRDNYSADVAFVASTFALGYLVHGIGQPAYVWLQAQGRPKVPATVHVVELLIFITAMPWLIAQLGLRGAALGWLGRVSLSVVALHSLRFVLNRKKIP